MSKPQYVYWNQADNRFWSNDDGWVDIDSATHFTIDEVHLFKHLPEGASPLQLVTRYYEIIGEGLSGGPITYRGQFYVVPGFGECYLAIQKQFGDVADWLQDDTFHTDLKRFSGTAIDFTSDDTDYRIRVDDESFDNRPKAYMLWVDKEALVEQINTLSGLLKHLSDDKYERTVGALQLLEEIRDATTA